QPTRYPERGLKLGPPYPVPQCVAAFRGAGREALAPNTVSLSDHIGKLLKPLLGAYKLRELTAVQVQDALRTIAKNHTSRTVAMSRNVLERSIRFAQAQDKVARNVAEVFKTPAGQKQRQGRQAF